MKKYFYSAAILALGFFATSCQQEVLEPVASSNTVTYTVQVPGVETRALGDELTNVKWLHYEVYRTDVADDATFDENDNLLYHEVKPVVDGRAVITLELVNNQNFTVLFWAQNSKEKEGLYYNVTDLTNVTVSQAAYANQNGYVAFTGVDFIEPSEKLAGRTITLVRPISQLNIATTEASLTSFDDTIVLEGSSVKVNGLSTSYNVASQAAGEISTEDFVYSEKEVPTETLSVNGTDYKYVAMNYVGFAPNDGTNVKVSYVINTSEGDIPYYIENVPVKPNYRTNIVGNLITATSDYTVTLEAEWDGVAEEFEIWDGKFLSEPKQNAEGQYEVGKPSELAWLAAAVNGTLPATTAVKSTPIDYSKQTYVLTGNIDLGNFPWTPIGLTGDNLGFNGTFDGAGYTISNLYVDLTDARGYKAAGLFGSARYGAIKNLTIENATVKSLDDAGGSSNGIAVLVGSAQFPLTISNVTVKNVVVEGNRRVAGIAGYFAGTIENCTVDNATITATPDLLASGKYDNGDKVGGIIGYANGKVVLTGNTVKNFTIKGYRDAGGVAGYATDAANNISGNTVIVGSVILDRNYDYCEVKGMTAGAVVGYGTPGENTVTNVAVANTDDDVETPDSFAEALANVADGGVVAVAAEDIVITAGELAVAGNNITIVGTTDDATITVDNKSYNPVKVYKNVTFKNLNINFADVKGSESYNGFNSQGNTLVFDNCTFTGQTTAAGGKFIYNNCSFKAENTYPAFVYSEVAEYNNCVFEGKDRAAKVYNEQFSCKATYNNCTFKAATADKAAVEIDCSLPSNANKTVYEVVINNATLVNMGQAADYGNEYFNLETLGVGLGIVTLDGKGYSVAHKASQISALADAGKSVTIEVATDITENVSFTQKKDLDIVLDGKGKEMNGTINITARAGKDAAGSLVIKDFNFKTTETAKDFIYSVENNYYPNNVTVSDCTFEGPSADSDVAPVRLKSSSNFVMENCTASGVHSLLQNTSGWNLTVRNCEVTNAGRGISLDSCQGVLIENVKIQASNEKYGIRANGAYANTTTIKNCEISAFIPVVVRKASAAYKLVFDGTNTMTAANTDGLWCAIGTSEYEKNGELPSVATGAVTVTLNDAGLSASGVCGASNL